MRCRRTYVPDKKGGRRKIAPTRICTHLLRNILNLFVCIKLNFFLYSFYSFGGYNRNNPAPGDHESNLKKVGAIPCGCNTKRTKKGCSLLTNSRTEGSVWNYFNIVHKYQIQGHHENASNITKKFIQIIFL